MSVDEHLDDLTSSLDELAQMIRNRNEDDMYPDSETWAHLRTEIIRCDLALWRTLSAMVGEDHRWPLRS